jgi:acetoacetyl-CoA synthetase
MSERIFWTPSPADLKDSPMTKFRDLAASRFQETFADYEAFCDWSIAHKENFWRLWLQNSDMILDGSLERAYLPNPSGDFFGGKWFPDTRLNYAENLMAHLPEQGPALIGLVEDGTRKDLSARELRSQVARLAAYLRAQGIGPGDRVAAILPNAPETVVALLAATSLGAVWSSCSPDFGEQGVLDRFQQIEPNVLFTANAYLYNGKRFELAEKNARLRASLPTLKAVVQFAHLGGQGQLPEGTQDFHRLVTEGLEPRIEFKRLPFQSPLFVMFSSGTTGKPKCIVHGIGGTLAQVTKEHQLHAGLRAGEQLLYYTTCGWMMWNWLVTGLASGARVVCFDGSPAAPQADSLWKLVDREGIEAFGTSARFIGSCRVQSLDLKGACRFEKLRVVFSTGSPLLPEDFDYFYEQVLTPSGSVPIQSISGGTDILSCFMLGTPLKPVVRGQIQARGLGMDVQAWDGDGRPVRAQQGELVCATPFPSMPLGFFNDPGDKAYRKAYFSVFPGVWHHGDYITLTEEGGIIVHGRSDATLNPGGVRIGTAEIYRQVETHPDVQDSIAVGRRSGDDEEIVLFVKLKDPSRELDEALVKELKDRIRQGASPRHVPKFIYAVPDIPYTLSGKKVEIAVKRVLHGEDPGNREALANPQCLEAYGRYGIPSVK